MKKFKFRSHEYNYNKKIISYMIASEDDNINSKPIVFFMNTIFGKIDDINEIYAHLNAQYNIVSIDFINIISKETLSDEILTIPEQSIVIKEILASCKITRKINIVSLCYGSLALLYYLKDHKALHQQINSIFCSGIFIGYDDSVFYKLNDFLQLCNCNNYEKALVNLYDDFFSNDYMLERKTEYYINKKLYLHYWMKQSKLNCLISLIRDEYNYLTVLKRNIFDYKEIFDHIKMYCLLADKDKIANVKLQSDILNSWGVEYEILLHTGHAIHIEKFDKFIQELILWLKKCRQGDRI